jgi:predicted transcriptional regulator
MEGIQIIIVVREDGTAILSDNKSEALDCQSYTNALALARVRAEKFIAERKVEKSIIAKKELDDASRDTGLAKEDKGESPDDVQQGEGAGSGFPKPKRIGKNILR